MTFIRPLLEYSCEVWGGCTVANAGRLAQLQLEAARIVTGLTAYASLSSLYAKTGWGKLNPIRKSESCHFFYNIVKGDTPDYLSNCSPGLSTRQKLQFTKCKYMYFHYSPLSSNPISKFIFFSHYTSME